MEKKGKSIYFLSRKTTDLTQEKVAEMANVSLEAYGAWERLETIPSNAVVVVLSEIFDDPSLMVKHFSRYDPIGRKFFPNCGTDESLLVSTVKLELAAKKILQSGDRLKEAACDDDYRNDDPELVLQAKNLCFEVSASLMGLMPKVMAACTVMGIS